MNDTTGKRRLWIVEGLLLLGFLGIASRLVYLHTDTDGAKTTSEYSKSLMAFRGRILDGGRSPNILAISLGVHDVCVDPALLAQTSNTEAAVQILAEGLGMAREELLPLVNRTNRFACVKRNVTRDITEPLMAIVSSNRVKGVMLQEATLRQYPQNTQACQIIGFVNRDGNGAMGVEMIRDKDLQGTPGEVVGVRDGRKKDIYIRRKREVQPRQGSDIVLTVDQQIQYFTERALDEAMQKHAAKAAWAVVQRCRTGEILAMGSRPGIDLNTCQNQADLYHCMTNRAISVVYEPGSTLKPVALALAFSRGTVKPETVIDCENGGWHHAGRILRDYHAYPRLSAADIIKKSSNIGTAKIALMMGDEVLYNGLRAFGFGKPLGLELPYEEGGILPPVKRWSGLSCSRISIGQGVAVTALQMAGMMSAIANGGYLLRPYLVKAVVNAEGRTVYEARPEVLGVPIDAKVSALMRYLLARVTEDGGTGTRARVEGFPVAGKTGTAQKPVPGGYSDTAYMASFAGFIPADRPEITIVVVVEEPQPYHTGGVVAAPVFARIAEQTVRYLNLEPSEMPADAEGHEGSQP